MSNPPACVSLNDVVIVGRGSSETLALEGNDSEVQLHTVGGLVDVDVCHRMGLGVLSVFVHETLNLGESFKQWDPEVGEVKDSVFGKDPVEPVPVAIVDCVSVTARQLVQLESVRNRDWFVGRGGHTQQYLKAAA